MAPGSEPVAALAFATMLVPFGAAQYITTDYLLAAFEALAMWGFVEARFGHGRHPRRWIALMWAGFGLAFLTKGPPGLLPLLAVFVFDALTPTVRGDGSRRVVALQWWGPLLFAAVALPWYLAVVVRTPGLLDYYVGAEVIDRIATDDFGRAGEWYGWLKVYVPTLLFGTFAGEWLRSDRAPLARTTGLFAAGAAAIPGFPMPPPGHLSLRHRLARSLQIRSRSRRLGRSPRLLRS